MTLGPGRKKDKEKSATKGRKKIKKGTQEQKTLCSSGFRGLKQVLANRGKECDSALRGGTVARKHHPCVSF